MRLQEIMSSAVKTISPGEGADLAWECMRGFGIHHLAVVEEGQVVGVVSQRDLGGLRGAAARAGRTIGEVMSRHVLTASPRTTVRQAANLLRGHAIGSLLVVEDGKLLGIVTVSDMLELLGRGVQRPVEQGKRWTLKHRGPRRKPGEGAARDRAHR
jgi:CBS domain-containing protein